MEQYNFGDLVFGEFPFDEARANGRDDGKSRWVFVLRDMGDTILVCYCTTNPEPTGYQAIRFGQLADGRVTNLVPSRVEAILKQRIVTSKGKQRVAFDHLLPYIGRAAKVMPQRFFGLADVVLNECKLQAGYAIARAQKKAAKVAKKQK